MYRLLLPLVLVAGGCNFDHSVPGDAKILCTTTAECPPGLTCRPSIGCLAPDAIDANGPSLISFELARAVIRPQDTLRVKFETSKALHLSPVLRLSAGALSAQATSTLISGSATSFQADVTLTAGWPDSTVLIGTTLLDESGNSVEASLGTFTVDGTPPHLVPGAGSFSLVPRPDAGLDTVAELGPRGVLKLSFVLDEDVASPPTLSGPLRCSVPVASARTWRSDCEVDPAAGELPRFELHLTVAATDLAGNAGSDPLDLGVFVRTQPPAAPDTSVPGQVLLERTPFGVGATGSDTRVLLAPGALSDDGLVIVYDSQGARLASGLSGTDGGAVLLGALDRVAVSVSVLDAAGNESARAAVHDGRLRLSAGGLGNPHQQRGYAVHGPFPDRIDEFNRVTTSSGPGRTEPLVVPGGWDWTRRTSPSPCPTAALGYDRRRARLVAFGGGCAGTQVFEFTGEAWTSRVPSDPENDGDPLPGGSFVYHPTLGMLLYVVVGAGEAQLWQWNGASFRQIHAPGGTDGGRTATLPRVSLQTATYVPALDEILIIGGFEPRPTPVPARSCFWSQTGWRCGVDSVGPLGAMAAAPIPGTSSTVVVWAPAAGFTQGLTIDGDGGRTNAAPPPLVGALVTDERTQRLMMLGPTSYEWSDGGWLDAGALPSPSPNVVNAVWDESVGAIRVVSWLNGVSTMSLPSAGGGFAPVKTVLADLLVQPLLGTSAQGSVLAVTNDGGVVMVNRLTNLTLEPAYPLPSFGAPFPSAPLIGAMTLGSGPGGPSLFTYRTDQQLLEVWGLTEDGFISEPVNPTPFPAVPLRAFAGGGWDPGQNRYLLVTGNPQLGKAFQSEGRGGATFRGTLVGADGGPTVETVVTTDDAGTALPMQLPESMTVITPPWASAAEVWGGVSLACVRSPGAYRVGDPWTSSAVPLPFAAEPMRPVVLPQLGLLPLVQHGLTRQYFAVADGGVTSVPLADPLGDGLAPPSRAGICAIAAHAAWDSNRQRIASVAANGTLWELAGPDQRPSQVLSLELSSALLPAGAATASLSARGLAGARGAPVDGGPGVGIELWIWDRSSWLSLGLGAGDETSLQPFEVTISDPTLLSRLLAGSAQTVQLAITSQAINGAGSVTLSTQAVELDFGYRVP